MGLFERFFPGKEAAEFKAPRTGEATPEQLKRSDGIEFYPDDLILADGRLHYYRHPNSGESYLAIAGNDELRIAAIMIKEGDEYRQVYPPLEQGLNYDKYLDYVDDSDGGDGVRLEGRLQILGGKGAPVGKLLIDRALLAGE